MSAELIREAAAKMRERAEAASATDARDWRTEHGGRWWPEGTRAGAYINSWHPGVALAVADWLDACALVCEVSPSATKAHALAVARAYLGGTRESPQEGGS